MGTITLYVDVIAAHGLATLDAARGGTNAFVELHFDGQTKRTAVRHGDVNPHWNEQFNFVVPPLRPPPAGAAWPVLEARVCHSRKPPTVPGGSVVVLGRVQIQLLSLAEQEAAAPPVNYPLQGAGWSWRSIRPRGGLTLRGFIDAGEMGSGLPFVPGGRPFDEFSVREIPSPPLRGEERGGVYDLVDTMEYLYVRVVKGRELIGGPVTGFDPVVELRHGNYTFTTRHCEGTVNPEWNEVFAFSRDRQQATHLDVCVRHRGSEDYIGKHSFSFIDIPRRAPPDSPLAPQWYRVVNGGGQARGEVMLAVWFGTQADECFPLAVHADAVNVDARLSTHIRGRAYHTPRMWYLRVVVDEAQDIHLRDPNRVGEVFVRTTLGHGELKTSVVRDRATSFKWTNDPYAVHWFVAAEPFEDDLWVSVVDRVAIDREEHVGLVQIPLRTVIRRYDDRLVRPRWHDLRRPGERVVDEEFSGKVCIRASLEGGYCVHTEPVHYCSDLRPTARELWKSNPTIGLLRLGIHRAVGLHPTNGRGSCDAYCVARYGLKWERTRTVINSFDPKFHAQYVWDVHDHATMLTVGVFNNCGLADDDGGRDECIGKVRIRLSTLEAGRIYTHAYPLIRLARSGVKRTGELHLAVQFSSASTLGIFLTYLRPPLPRRHYSNQFPFYQQDRLRQDAVRTVVNRFGRMEPPLRAEVVEEMCEQRITRWSMRRSKANYFRLLSATSCLLSAYSWFCDVCSWRNPLTTALVHILYTMLAIFPTLIIPTFFLYLFLLGMWNYRWRPRHPPHMDVKVSYADMALPDELDEEFDEAPTEKSHDVVRMRYDRLRRLAGNIQTMAGNVAMHGERFVSLLTWRDPRATAMFLLFCLAMAALTYTLPDKAVYYLVVVIPGFYAMRHPVLRRRTPMLAANFYRRLPSRTDCLL